MPTAKGIDSRLRTPSRRLVVAWREEEQSGAPGSARERHSGADHRAANRASYLALKAPERCTFSTVVARATRALVLVGVACGFSGATFAAAAPSTGRSAAGSCPVTAPKANMRYGNASLRAVLPRGGNLVVSDAHPPVPASAWFGQIHADGSVSVKLAWEGSARGRLRITGARLDGHARPLRAHVATGTPHFWASRLTFASPGCWRVTGRVGAARLSLVLAVSTASS
jgi:hypothetical protein